MNSDSTALDRTGALLDSYGSKAGAISLRALGAAVIALISFACALFIESLFSASGVLSLMVAVTVGLAGGAFLVVSLDSSSGRFDLYERGLAVYARGKRRFVPFEDVVAVYVLRIQYKMYGVIPTRRTADYTIALRRGSDIRVPSAAGRRIETEVYRLLRPLYLKAFQSGADVWFGPVCVNSHAVKFRGRSDLPWQAVKTVSVSGGYLRFKASGASARGLPRIAVGDIPNFALFLEVAGVVAAIA
ncbi:MAG: DUF6585 family protein [Dehalococcoidia bacterium]